MSVTHLRPERFAISELSEKPQFLETAADCIWLEGWQAKGVSQTHILNRTRESLDHTSVPSTFIAHEGEEFWGSVALISNDLESRPQYTPWVAALLVQPEQRSKGVATRLVTELETFAKNSGIDRLYLCAIRPLRQFYESRGWVCIEEDVDGLDVFDKRL
ncbi:N-acetyltransferase [Pseudovibrio japonicus]|uniref:N-acetyltransferase n=1 Tax=Pseudovibrio japonicus TaxID=366534 RepID=A0ABQ3E4S8_9HYPH|nr:GNAT family N-acetyltransferase [Pseudovibrio japonicus]GHB22430.1 N-acetyltransferase [Pseudovibrio japonicus]